MIPLLELSCFGQLVPFLSNPAYERNEPTPAWYVTNNLAPSLLYLDGVYQSQETGSNSLDMASAWALQPDAIGIKVGICDIAGAHGLRVADIVSTMAPGVTIQFAGLPLDADFFQNNLCWLATNGCSIIVLTSGWPISFTEISNACRFVESKGVILVCAVPNVEGDLDAGFIDYPHEWRMSNTLCVASTDRNGVHYVPSARGTNVVSAPGRNIIGNGTYSSGTSWATAIVAGEMALMVKHFLPLSPAGFNAMLRDSCTGPDRLINPTTALGMERRHYKNL